MKVFVVDNSAILCKQIIDLLTELHGIEIVGQAQVALEALCAIRERKPDVVTLDIQMSGGSGIDVLKKIKQADQAPVVIMLTNSTAPPFRRRCIEVGADFFLDKSTEFGKVKEIVQGLLEQFSTTLHETPLDCFGG
jgi:DNA-binding NarL/FixJ family response regulator